VAEVMNVKTGDFRFPSLEMIPLCKAVKEDSPDVRFCSFARSAPEVS
jgi:hypothetical protein